MQVATSEYVTAVMNLIESGDVSWNDADVAKTLRDAIRGSHRRIITKKSPRIGKISK